MLSAENQMSEAAQLRSIRLDRHRDATQQITETDSLIAQIKQTFDAAGTKISKSRENSQPLLNACMILKMICRSSARHV